MPDRCAAVGATLQIDPYASATPRRISRYTVRGACVALLVVALCCATTPAAARTVYRCVREGTVSLATAPEPGSTCTAKQIDDNTVQTPNVWGNMGVFSGTLYQRQQDGVTVYSTRRLPGSTVFLKFTATTPPGEQAHAGLGTVGAPLLDRYAGEFKAAARRSGVDDAWLRATAHAESGFDAAAISPKGAMGVMQLMPELAQQYRVDDPFSARQSIDAGARHMKALLKRYDGDRTLAAAAYNAGIGAVTRYDGVPPYAETEAYIDKVLALYARYRAALGRPIETPAK